MLRPEREGQESSWRVGRDAAAALRGARPHRLRMRFLLREVLGEPGTPPLPLLASPQHSPSPILPRTTVSAVALPTC